MARKFNYNMDTLTLVTGQFTAFMDNYSLPLTIAPQSIEGKLLVALSDIYNAYAPDFEYQINLGKAVVTHKGRSVVCDVYNTSNETLVDAVGLLTVGFGKSLVQTGIFNAFGECEKPKLDMLVEDFILARLRGKQIGDLYKTFWHDDLKRTVPYRVTVPINYNIDRPSKLIVGLHGGGGSPDNVFKSTNNQIQYLADKYNYIILAPDAVVSNSTYGLLAPIAGMRNITIDPNNRLNPLNYSDEELEGRRLSKEGIDKVISIVCSDYNIDTSHIYLMGNSMGGAGTLYYASVRPGMFKAIVPAGASPDMDYFDDSGLQKIPILFIAGVEDSHGFDYMEQGAAILKQRGRNITFRAVAGGTHGDAWVKVLDEIFEFLNLNA